ncbi:hypothetical protein [Pseudofulvibacter geojedonensis]|uniref:Uncharacterized protein n=1 Tax=Pseudofulvibacter geojedonensis TaxID=1123758 RepID=A0ABW3I520_9FLAO
MFKKLLYLILFTSLSTYSQKAKLPESKYVDIEVKNSLVYAVSKTNKLVVWDMKDGSIKYIKKNISCVTKTKKDDIYCATTDGEIFKETSTNKWKKEGGFTGKPYAIFKTKNNQIASLSSKGIKFNSKYFLPTEKHRIGNGIYSYKNNKLRKPNLTYIDSKDRIWISYDFGKFSEVFIFDTKKSSYVNNKLLLVPDDKKDYNSKEEYMAVLRKKQLKKYDFYIKKEGKEYSFKFPVEAPLYFGLKSICQDEKGNYYFSEGLPYSHRNSGIFAYTKTPTKDFYQAKEHLEKQLKLQRNEIIGQVAFNSYDKSLYYYSNYGFYKITKKEGQLNNELIIDPNVLLYEGAISHEYGKLINVKKIVFTGEEQFVFLTSQYGFGHFDGSNINLYN